jgi:hypothetical protein
MVQCLCYLLFIYWQPLTFLDQTTKGIKYNDFVNMELIPLYAFKRKFVTYVKVNMNNMSCHDIEMFPSTFWEPSLCTKFEHF